MASHKHFGKGLDGRHRDENGQISRKHGNTLVGHIEKKYDVEIPVRADTKLENALDKLGFDSMTQMVKEYK